MKTILSVFIVLVFVNVISSIDIHFAQQKGEPLVLTPGGWFPKSCVHHVREHDAVIDARHNDYILVTYANGTRTHFPSCYQKAIPLNANKRSTKQQQQGWVAYAMWQAPSTVTSYLATWVVPTNPTQEEVQTLFLFNGLQNAYDSMSSEFQTVSIIQPVLQWGLSEAGGGNYWSIASWFVGSGAVYSTLEQVSVGDVLLGKMIFDSNSTWSIICTDTTSKVSTTLNVATNTLEPYAFITLEVYGVNDCGDYPNGDTKFTKIALLNKSKPLKPNWSPQVVAQCNEAVKVVNAQTVDIKY